ncbi:MAG: hypothetical protein HYX68_18465 [Planctomycetes bacterium]|nr:hypothetical protein [Planctomycetota bacterium]
MGNRKAREFVKKQELDAAWLQVTNQPRSALTNVIAPGIGRRCIQLILSPSFETGRAWEIREFRGEWRLFGSEIISDVGRPMELIGYSRLSIASAILESFTNRLLSISLPIATRVEGMDGADGVIYQLATFGDFFSEARFQWWSYPPSAWRPLADIAAEMIKAFQAARPLASN